MILGSYGETLSPDRGKYIEAANIPSITIQHQSADYRQSVLFQRNLQ